MDVDIERVIKNIEEAYHYDQMILSVIMRKSDNKIMSIKSLIDDDKLNYSEEGKDILND